MKDSTIKQMIQSIKDLAESRAKSDENIVKKFEKLYNDVKEENNDLKDELSKAQCQVIESIVEIKYLQQRLKDLEDNKFLSKEDEK